MFTTFKTFKLIVRSLISSGYFASPDHAAVELFFFFLIHLNSCYFLNKLSCFNFWNVLIKKVSVTSSSVKVMAPS